MDVVGQPGLPHHSHFETHDPEEASEAIARMYGPATELRLPRHHPFRARVDAITTREVTLLDFELPFDVTYSVAGQGDYVFVTQTLGTPTYERRAGVRRYRPGDNYIAITSDDDCRIRVERAQGRAVTLPAALLDEVAQQATERPLHTWRFTALTPTPGMEQRWLRAIVNVEEVLRAPQRNVRRLSLGPATRLLAATTLAAFPNTALDDGADPHFRDDHPDALRRAVAFIDGSPDADVTLDDVARAARVSPRAVQLGFRRHLDTTPMAYLRQVRLHHAHEQLRKATPDSGLTVTDVAYAWGFSTPSRFAEQYRAAYGRPPAQTLRG